jgi:hypothetical protein
METGLATAPGQLVKPDCFGLDVAAALFFLVISSWAASQFVDELQAKEQWFFLVRTSTSRTSPKRSASCDT